jgi:hypothetical protein
MNNRMEYQKDEIKHFETLRTKILEVSGVAGERGVQIMWLPQAAESKGQQNR